MEGETEEIECNTQPCDEDNGLPIWVVGILVGVGSLTLVTCFALCICKCAISRNKNKKKERVNQGERPEQPVYVLNVLGESNMAYKKRESALYSEIPDL